MMALDFLSPSCSSHPNDIDMVQSAMALRTFYLRVKTPSVKRTLENLLVFPSPVVYLRPISTSKAGRVTKDQIVVACHPGLENILAEELTALGLNPKPITKKSKRGLVALPPTPVTNTDLFRCCLYLGSATNIRWKCSSFSARGLAELRRKTANVDWSQYIKIPDDVTDGSPLGRIDVRVSSYKSKLFHTGAIRERILLGIFESFGFHDMENSSQIGRLKEEYSGERGDCNLVLDAKVERDQVDIFVNAYPTPLHQRGYRLQTAKAPLREDLAYAMLYAAGWLPAWIPSVLEETPRKYPGLLDPFCGSGTIIIEGLSMALGLPPGRLKSCPFQGTVIEDPNLWKMLQENAQKTENKGGFPTVLRVSASDRDSGAVKAIQANAERAGLWEYLDNHLHECALSGQPWLENPSESPSQLLVVTNPPFGKRVSQKNQLLPLYQTLGHSVHNLSAKHSRDATCVVLTDDPIFTQRVGHGCGLNSTTLLRINHGGQKVSVLEWKSKSRGLERN
jgi:23S rRNA G2445 N2-methylase RlmL